MNFNKGFLEISHLYPNEVVCGQYTIKKNRIPQNAIDSISEDSNFFPYKNYLSSDKDYVSLIKNVDGKAMMSNYETETITNQKFLDNVKGDVLIFGLGLGLIVFPILLDDNVKSIDIVEIDNGLINYVGDIIKKEDKFNKVNIIEGDLREYHNIISKSYDTIYFDIWEFVGEQELMEIKELHQTYLPFLNKNGWIDSWRSEKMKQYGI
jgi:spermidine synthase